MKPMIPAAPVIELRALADIAPYANNVKSHDPRQVDKIAASITEFGWDQPIVVDARGVIIKGHGRRLAALQLGMTHAPVWVRADLSPAQVRAARLADNRVAVSNIDSDLLQVELADLDFDMERFFDKKELDFLASDMGTLNEGAFVADLDAALSRQTEETATAVLEAGEQDVAVARALGFKAVKGRDERAIAMFMARLEGESGLLGAEAFMAHIKAVTA